MTLIELADLAKTNGWNIVDQILYELYINSPSGGSGGGYTIIDSSVLTVSTVNIGAGSLAATFTTSEDFVGTINGVSREASTSYVFNPTSGFLNPELSLVITAGTVVSDVYRKAS